MADMERERRSIWATVTIAVLLVPILYVLSIGPANWLIIRGVVGSEPLAVVYAPIDWMANRSEPFTEAVMWYLDWWNGSRQQLPLFSHKLPTRQNRSYARQASGRSPASSDPVADSDAGSAATTAATTAAAAS
jgi:hypothetical protein